MTATRFISRPLHAATWPDFAALVERHDGVWGGCWCIAFHGEEADRTMTAEDNRRAKEVRVKEGRAHAALVYDGPRCIGWCQFGATHELPRIKHRRRYEAGLTKPPAWRITCFFVDRGYRGQGVAAAALQGALDEIARLGGGAVESYPEDTTGRSAAAGFLHNATVSLFERHGFTRERQIGKHHWVVRRTLAASRR